MVLCCSGYWDAVCVAKVNIQTFFLIKLAFLSLFFSLSLIPQLHFILLIYVWVFIAVVLEVLRGPLSRSTCVVEAGLGALEALSCNLDNTRLLEMLRAYRGECVFDMVIGRLYTLCGGVCF